MPPYELLIGADAFWSRARADIAAARSRVFVQAMTFEGDAVGRAVAEAIAESGAARRRVRVDAYSRVMINDRRVASRAGRRDAPLQAEAAATLAMFAGLKARGVEVTWTSPIRAMWRDYPFRNHRKLIVADDVAWIGGVNFSDHNFAWDDLMVRIPRADVADRLAADFPPRGTPDPAAWRESFGDLDVHALDGGANREGFAPILALIAGAAAEVVVFSPYLTPPFTPALARAAARGVRVRVVTPQANNKPLLRAHILDAARRGGFEAVQTPGMSHVKAMLVDGRALVLGSSNFDFVSYEAEAELMGVFRDPALIANFRTRVLEPALARAGVPASGISNSKLRYATEALKAAQLYVRTLRRLR